MGREGKGGAKIKTGALESIRTKKKEQYVVHGGGGAYQEMTFRIGEVGAKTPLAGGVVVVKGISVGGIYI